MGMLLVRLRGREQGKNVCGRWFERNIKREKFSIPAMTKIENSHQGYIVVDK